MKYITCKMHQYLKVHSYGEFEKHVKNKHWDEIEFQIERVLRDSDKYNVHLRNWIFDSVLDSLYLEKEVEDEAVDEFPRAINYDKIKEDIKKGKQKVFEK